MSLQFDPANPLKLKRSNSVSLQNGEDEEINEEERLLEQDIEGNSKKRGRGKPPTEIDVTGYDEDSSDDEYDGIKKTKVGGNDKEGESDDDSDMFGSDEENSGNDEKDKNPTRKKSQVELLDLEQFEKENEVKDQISTEDLQESQSDDDHDEDEEELKDTLDYYNDPESVRAHMKVPKKEPKLDAFNLKNEKSEGTFDVDGNFIALDNADGAEDNDADWLLNIKKKDIKKAKLAQQERAKKEQDKRESKKVLSTEELLFRLITVLKPVESPLEALQRYNKGKPAHRKRSVKITKSLEEQRRELQVLELTEYCESLIEKGFRNVYELEKEELMLKYREESGKNYVKPKVEDDSKAKEEKANEANNPTEEQGKWQFKWLGDDQVHGPYGLNEMVYWKDNYFDSKVEVRRVGEEEFIHIDKVTF